VLDIGASEAKTVLDGATEDKAAENGGGGDRVG